MEFQLASHAKSNMKVPQNSIGVSAPVVDKIREAMRTKMSAKSLEEYADLMTLVDRVDSLLREIVRRFSSRRRVASTPSSVGLNGGGHESTTMTFTNAVYTFHTDIRKRKGLKEQMTPLAEFKDKL